METNQSLSERDLTVFLPEAYYPGTNEINWYEGLDLKTADPTFFDIPAIEEEMRQKAAQKGSFPLDNNPYVAAVIVIEDRVRRSTIREGEQTVVFTREPVSPL